MANKWLKKLEKWGNIKLLRIAGFDIRVWMIAFAILMFYFFTAPQSYSILGSGYEGPQMEFVAVQFYNQPGRDGSGRTITLNGIYSQSKKSPYQSTWSWQDPSNVHIDPDGRKAGIPNLKFISSGFGQCDTNLQDSKRPIDSKQYKILRNGKEWEVESFEYWFKVYITAEAVGDEDMLNLLYDEVGFNVKCDIWMKIGINQWQVADYDNELWAGILKLEVRDDSHDQNPESRAVYSPDASGQLSLLSDINGGSLGQYSYDDFSSGWQNPDNIPDKGYFKTSIDFTVGKNPLESAKIYHPWAKWTLVARIIVTHRFIATDQNLGGYNPPNLSDEITWLDKLENLVDQIIKGVDIVNNLLKLLLYIGIGFAVLIGALIVITNVMKLSGGRRR
ncbi:hypothetical protein [Candidatus Borrarchaeum sp.]|uniref:hypothetical protein n=1 Tax=Candidatus Borrarchaeum sp. TaxID=2846742 RepID=UPI00257DA4E8|nr:hypothetical protein [Candidatus Borrarchaeum sp.]